MASMASGLPVGLTIADALGARGWVAEPELRLIERAATGERAAVRQILEYLYPLVHKHLSFMLGFGSSVDDAVQESMLQIHRALPRFRNEAALKTWALKIASRTARRQQARDRRHSVCPAELAEVVCRSYEPSLEARSRLARLSQCLQALHPKKREAFVLMAIEGFTAAEAGKILGVFANTAASRCRHARSELEVLMAAAPAKPI